MLFIVNDLPYYNQQGDFATAIEYIEELLPSVEEMLKVIALGMSLVTCKLEKRYL